MHLWSILLPGLLAASGFETATVSVAKKKDTKEVARDLVSNLVRCMMAIPVLRNALAMKAQDSLKGAVRDLWHDKSKDVSNSLSAIFDSIPQEPYLDDVIGGVYDVMGSAKNIILTKDDGNHKLFTMSELEKGDLNFSGEKVVFINLTRGTKIEEQFTLKGYGHQFRLYGIIFREKNGHHSYSYYRSGEGIWNKFDQDVEGPFNFEKIAQDNGQPLILLYKKLVSEDKVEKGQVYDVIELEKKIDALIKDAYSLKLGASDHVKIDRLAKELQVLLDKQPQSGSMERVDEIAEIIEKFKSSSQEMPKAESSDKKGNPSKFKMPKIKAKDSKGKSEDKKSTTHNSEAEKSKNKKKH